LKKGAERFFVLVENESAENLLQQVPSLLRPLSRPMRGSGSKDPRVPCRILYFVFRYVGPINAGLSAAPVPLLLNEHASRKACDPECNGRDHRAHKVWCGMLLPVHTCRHGGARSRVPRNGTLSANPNPRNATFERRTLQEKVVVSVLSRAGRSAAVLSAACKRPWRGVNQSWWIVNATNETRVDTVFQ